MKKKKFKVLAKLVAFIIVIVSSVLVLSGGDFSSFKQNISSDYGILKSTFSKNKSGRHTSAEITLNADIENNTESGNIDTQNVQNIDSNLDNNKENGIDNANQQNVENKDTNNENDINSQNAGNKDVIIENNIDTQNTENNTDSQENYNNKDIQSADNNVDSNKENDNINKENDNANNDNINKESGIVDNSTNNNEITTLPSDDNEKVKVFDDVIDTKSHYKLKLTQTTQKEFDADLVKFDFSINEKCDTISGCLENIENKLSQLKNDLLQLDSGVTIDTNYYSCRPQLENGQLMYDCYYTFSLKTAKTQNINDLIKIVEKAKVDSIYSPEYMLSDETNAKNQVLSTAIENIKTKAQNINGGAKLVKIDEGYSCCYSQNGKVVVKTTITGCFITESNE